MKANNSLRSVFLQHTNVSGRMLEMVWLSLKSNVMLAVVVSIRFLRNINWISVCTKRLSFVNTVDVFLLTKTS